MSLAFKILVLILTTLAVRMACLELDQAHQTSLKSTSTNGKQTSGQRTAKLDQRRWQKRNYHQSKLVHRLPLHKTAKKQDEEAVDVPLAYNQLDIGESIDKNNNQLMTMALADRLADILTAGAEQSSQSLTPIRVLNMKKKKKKRSAIKKRLAATGDDLPPEEYFNYNSGVEQQKITGSDLAKKLVKRKSMKRVLDDHFGIGKEKKKKEVGDKKKTAGNVIDDRLLSKNAIKKRNKRVPQMTDASVIKEINGILGEDKAGDNVEVNNDNKKIEDKNSDTVNKIIATDEVKSKLRTKRIPDGDFFSDDEDGLPTEEVEELPIPEPVEASVAADPDKDQEKDRFAEWLRREYYDTLAKSLATMRKKRQDQTDDNFMDNYVDGPLNDDDDDNFDRNPVPSDDMFDDNDNDNTNNDNTNNDNGNNETNKLKTIFSESTDSIPLQHRREIVSDDNDANEDYVIAAADEDEALFNDRLSPVLLSRGLADNDDNVDDEAKAVDDEAKKKRKRKRKRSVSPYFGRIADDEQINDDNAGERRSNEDDRRFGQIDNRLEGIEDQLIEEALSIIKETAAIGNQNKATRSQVENRLEAAYDIEDMRQAIGDLHRTIDKIGHEDDDNSLTNSLMIVPDDETNDIEVRAVPVEELTSKQTDELDDEADSSCYALDLLTSDCSAVKDLVPGGQIGRLFTGACNWHEVCYTCGEVFGLMSSDCDAGFLEAGRLACSGAGACEAAARLILTPLRQTRVFYKKSVPSVCQQSTCVREFLFQASSSRDRERRRR